MAKLTKEEKAQKKAQKKGIVKEFKEFIARGNVLDMAIGVVIGGAFSAIVNSVVNVLLSVCMWAVPGGLKGLVTVLPAISDPQKGMAPDAGLGQKFAAADLHNLAVAQANALYGAEKVEANPNLVESVKTTILGKYTLHGTQYTYNLSAVIDWGAVINAVISFIIIAIVLFIIVKLANKARAAREEMKAKLEKKEEPAEEAVAE